MTTDIAQFINPGAARITLIKGSNQVLSSLGNGGSGLVTWDTNLAGANDAFTHTAGTSAITVVNAGAYSISANVGFLAGNARSTAGLIARINGAVDFRHGIVYGYTRGTNYGKGTAGFRMDLNLAAGQTIEMLFEVEDTDSTYNFTLYGGDASFNISKLN